MARTVYPPSEALQPFIRSFTIEETAQPAIHKVLPGTTAVMGFQFRGSLSIVIPDKTGTPFAPDNTGTLLAQFTETGAANFFKTPLHLLFNGSYSLEDLIPASEINRLEEQLTAAPDHSATSSTTSPPTPVTLFYKNKPLCSQPIKSKQNTLKLKAEPTFPTMCKP